MRHDAPLTRYLCALIEVSEGRITADVLRERWKAGEFKGVKPEWASEYAARMGVR